MEVRTAICSSLRSSTPVPQRLTSSYHMQALFPGTRGSCSEQGKLPALMGLVSDQGEGPVEYKAKRCPVSWRGAVSPPEKHKLGAESRRV